MAATDSDFGDVIKLLTPYDLKELYYELGISSRDMQTWEADAGERASVYLRARSVLETWRKQEGSKASRQAILDALENCKNKDAKEKLQSQWGKAEKIYEKYDSLNVYYDLIMLQRLIFSSCVWVNQKSKQNICIPKIH